MIPVEPIEYLKQHIGCKFSIAVYGKHRRKWAKGPLLLDLDLKNYNINCCQELPNEITLESDYKSNEVYKNKENQLHAESLLLKSGAAYYVSSHSGKCDYVRFRFTTKQSITPQLRLAIIRFFAKPGLQFDEAFFSLNYVRPIPNRPHWKYTERIEKVIKIVEGQDLDIDILGIKEPLKAAKRIYSGSMPFVKVEDRKPMGWALAIKISVMAKRYNLTHCPKCSTPFIFLDKPGIYKCNSCKTFGSIKTFAKLCLHNEVPA